MTSVQPITGGVVSALAMPPMTYNGGWTSAVQPPPSNPAPLKLFHHARSALFVCLFALLILAPGCATSPRPKGHSIALENPYQTWLGSVIESQVRTNEGKSGFRLLENGAQAFSARLALTTIATRTIDLQYYIAHGQSVSLLGERLIEAADRGVRVRVLLDDLSAHGQEAFLSIIDTHPLIEVRVWNPVYSRGFRPVVRSLEFLFRAWHLNRRMHNKVFVADNVIGIVGGRNVGDEYFDAPGAVQFQDLDVLAAGPVVQEMSVSFDAYWNSPPAVPLASVSSRRPKPAQLEKAIAELRALRSTISNSPYGEMLRKNEQLLGLSKAGSSWIWAKAVVVADDPGKTAGDGVVEEESLVEKINLPESREELLVIAPYFVPGSEGVKYFTKLCKQGVRVRILSNSLAGNDAWLVHCGYRHYRKSLIRGGVALYELRPSIQHHVGRQDRTATGSSLACLHAKIFVVDRKTVFIGSMNLDPRSTHINTELGLLIESPELAEQARAIFERLTKPQNAYTLSIDPGTRKLKWTCEQDGKAAEYSSEPEASFWLRFGVSVLSFLPLESQL